MAKCVLVSCAKENPSAIFQISFFVKHLLYNSWY